MNTEKTSKNIFTCMLFLMTGSPEKLILEKDHEALIILFDVSPSSRQLQRNFFIKKKQPLFK